MALRLSFSDECFIECGCDEAGRGCLAGPLYVAAVILPPGYQNSEIDDSKKLSRAKRNSLRIEIEANAVAFSVIPVPVEKIDKLNILKATYWGMNEAVKTLAVIPELILIDGNRFENKTGIPHNCIVKGDATFQSIAAASILAKSYRDDFMEKIDKEYPCYEWAKNKGYPTLIHQKALLKWGRTPYHRKSFHLKSQLRLNF